MHTATRWGDDVIEASEVADKERLGIGRPVAIVTLKNRTLSRGVNRFIEQSAISRDQCVSGRPESDKLFKPSASTTKTLTGSIVPFGHFRR
ncbi:MAG: hypothetical protein J2P54_13370, partial [Bradyrhizobiaceae bacterium]|nr:hypothetical protein [Bradyrhizobiaceae bacterium]